MICPVHYSLAVGGPPRAAVVAELVGQLFEARAIHVHYVDVEVAVLQRCEDELLPVGRQHAFGGIDAEVGESAESRAVGAGGVDVERVEPPHIALRRIGSRRAILLERLARREENAPVTVHEISAGCLADAARYSAHPRAVDVHHVLLVAGPTVAGALENEPLSVVAEIGFGILAAVGELPDVAQMLLARLRGD